MADHTFYFYDLETTGINSRQGRIMQFAGQRTNLDLQPIGKADNFLIKVTEDILPEPEAVLITGITPQLTLKNGLTEAEFCRYFDSKINLPKTIFVGFNNIRFDDEFMRHLFYRNFYDAYEWQWQDNNSRWDILDVVRLTRALRPQGINWPFASDGAPSNQLGLLTAINKLEHSNAHDALSDVNATIALARLIHDKQPKLFGFLLKMRSKQAVSNLVLSHQPFIYSSGQYPSQYEKTTVAAAVAKHPRGDSALVFDLRYDPTDFDSWSAADLASAWFRRDPAEGPLLPVKILKFNRCPAVAPTSVLDEDSHERLQLDMSSIEVNFTKLSVLKNLPGNLLKALDKLDQQKQTRLLPDAQDIDDQLYDDFFSKTDKQTMSAIRAAQPEELNQLLPQLKDSRLQALLPLYKARNYRDHLTPDELKIWQIYRKNRLMAGGQASRLNNYLARLHEISNQPGLSQNKRHLLKDLEHYAQSITKDLS